MTHIKQTLIVILLLCTSLLSEGQTKRETLNLELEAKEYFRNFEFYKALQTYLELDQHHPNNTNYMYHIGVCYLDLNESKKALPYLKAAADNPKLPNSLNYYLAKTYHLEHYFEEAIDYYKKYLINFPDLDKHEENQQEIEREIASCLYAKTLYKDSLNVIIHNFGKPINSTYPEYNAFFSADEETVVFTSDRPSTIRSQIHRSNGSFYEDIYISYKTNDIWSEPVSISNKINTWHHEVAVAFSHDGHQLLFYRYSHSNPLHTSGDLYLSEFRHGTWSDPELLPHPINTKHWESSACFSTKKNEILFTSNRKGGYGGTDIYKSHKLSNGTWSEPENLGPEINTSKNEDSPFLLANNTTLYFSSNGHLGMGGYDMFSSEFNKNDSTWSTPENIGYPLNTAGDNLQLTVSADGTTFYYSDQQDDSFGDRDIYLVQQPKPAADILIVTGVVKNSLNDSVIDAVIKVQKSNQPEVVNTFYPNTITGKYLLLMNKGFDYTVFIEAEGFATLKYSFEISNLSGFYKENINMILSPIELAKEE